MQSFTRSGLTIEQCSGCRGVFLDYGELERLVQMESSYHQQVHAPMPPPAAPMHGAPLMSHGHGHVQYHGHAFGHRPHSKHYRKSLLGELLDI
jgi:Zn-finger nucleic acid-binding protein